MADSVAISFDEQEKSVTIKKTISIYRIFILAFSRKIIEIVEYSNKLKKEAKTLRILLPKK